MHDVVSHNIQVMVTLADAAAIAQRYGSATRERSHHEVAGAGRQALSDMRRLLGLLRDGTDGVRTRCQQEHLDSGELPRNRGWPNWMPSGTGPLHRLTVSLRRPANHSAFPARPSSPSIASCRRQ
jgi:hypothetical protein